MNIKMNLLGVLAAVLFSFWSVSLAHAQSEVTCPKAPCEVISLAALANQVTVVHQTEWQPDNYLTYGGQTFISFEMFSRFENPWHWVPFGQQWNYVPRVIRVNRGRMMSIPQMGLNWERDRIIFQSPATMVGNPDSNTTLTSFRKPIEVLVSNIATTTVEAEGSRLYNSYYWNPKQNFMLYWTFLPVLTGDELQVYVFDFKFVVLEASDFPPSEIDWHDVETLNPYLPQHVLHQNDVMTLVRSEIVVRFKYTSDYFPGTNWSVTDIWSAAKIWKFPDGTEHYVYDDEIFLPQGEYVAGGKYRIVSDSVYYAELIPIK